MTQHTKPSVTLPQMDANPAIILFGYDDSGKPHASSFDIERRHEAIKAAGLMGLRALAVEGETLVAIAAKIPVGKVFGSGKGFVPFVKREVGAQLDQVAKDHPDLLITVPKPDLNVATNKTTSRADDVTALTELPKDWDSIKTGSRVLAVDVPEDGWWVAIVQHVHEGGSKGQPMQMLTLKWEAFPEDGTFVRRFDHVALMHPACGEDEIASPNDNREG
ncbi:hypothetical protein OO012_15000 [Rhodobacteraceae bacterium KMM 6894]|nr:hypothetical protein [Rhodobacteraceae bacterium KMM 6894]